MCVSRNGDSQRGEQEKSYDLLADLLFLTLREQEACKGAMDKQIEHRNRTPLRLPRYPLTTPHSIPSQDALSHLKETSVSFLRFRAPFQKICAIARSSEAPPEARVGASLDPSRASSHVTFQQSHAQGKSRRTPEKWALGGKRTLERGEECSKEGVWCALSMSRVCLECASSVP